MNVNEKKIKGVGEVSSDDMDFEKNERIIKIGKKEKQIAKSKNK